MKIRYTLLARDDLISITDYIAVRSPQAARRIKQRIRTIISLLSEHPFIGSRTSDPTIRRLVTTPYPFLVFYEVTESNVIILAVRHAARDPSTMPDKS